MNSIETQARRLGLRLTMVAGLIVVGMGVGVPLAEAAAAAKCGNSTGASWDQHLTGSCRYTVLTDFGGAAVRDNNTGLVWEQAPDPTANLTWSGAVSYCANKPVGGTAGWRLPSAIELKSIQDPSLPAPFVPATVFTGVIATNFWSATTNADNAGLAWGVHFGNGSVFNFGNKPDSGMVWCVRGPMQESAY